VIIRIDVRSSKQALSGFLQHVWGQARSGRATFYLVLGALLLLPHIFGSRWAPSKVGFARVYSGDEPHYLIQIKSLVRDHDLDISNNYEWAGVGADDAGKGFRGEQLERHTAAQANGRTVIWSDYFSKDRWKKKADGSWPPAPLHEGRTDPPTFRYSIHPEGIALLLLPIWLAVGDSPLLEPVAILFSGIITLLGLFFFRSLASRFTSDALSIKLALVATFLGTPLWHYGRTLFTEPYMASFAVAAYALAYRPRRPWLAGFPIAAGLLMKPVFVLIPLPLVVLFLLRRRYKDTALAAAPVLAVLTYMAVMNTIRFGGPLSLSLPNLFEWNFAHAGDLAFDWLHGLLPFAPVVALALIGWFRLLREGSGEAWAIACGAGLYYLLFSCWTTWHGGYCFGPRYLVPIIPLIMVGVVKVPEMVRGRGFWVGAAALAVTVLSIQINALGAVPYWRYWYQHPLATLF
jgi:hypothetical protein